MSNEAKQELKISDPAAQSRKVRQWLALFVWLPLLLVIGVVANWQSIVEMFDTSPAVEVAATQICSEQNDRKRVITEGFIGIPSVVSCKDGHCSLDLKERPAAKEDLLTLRINTGEGADTMDTITNFFSESSVTIRDAEGNRIENKARIQFSGRVDYSKYDSGSEYCYLDVETLSKAEDQSIPSIQGANELNFADIGTDKFVGEYSVIEGFIRLQDSVNCKTYCNLAFSETKDFKKAKKIFVQVGDEANEVKSPGIIYFDYDVTFRDKDGKELKTGDKVKLFGIVEKTEVDGKTEFQFQVEQIEQA